MTASGQDTVLVVGAGPVGLTAAAELVRQGARVRVVDRLAEPTTQSRAVVVHPRTQEHLAAMGVLTHGNVRISLTRDTTYAEIDRFCAVVPGVVRRIRAEVGM